MNSAMINKLSQSTPTLDEVTDFLQVRWGLILTSYLEIAVAMHYAKAHIFHGEYMPWLKWATSEFYVKKRQAISLCNAGECLEKHWDKWGVLAQCSVEKLEMLDRLPDKHMEFFMANHQADVDTMSRDEVRMIVNRYLGQGHEGEPPAPAPKQLVQPMLPWEELLQFDPEELDAMEELRFVAAHVHRIKAAKRHTAEEIELGISLAEEMLQDLKVLQEAMA